MSGIMTVDITPVTHDYAEPLVGVGGEPGVIIAMRLVPRTLTAINTE